MRLNRSTLLNIVAMFLLGCVLVGLGMLLQ